MMEIGTKIFESWFIQNIGTGYTHSKIFEKIDGKVKLLRFHRNVTKKYLFLSWRNQSETSLLQEQ